VTGFISLFLQVTENVSLYILKLHYCFLQIIHILMRQQAELGQFMSPQQMLCYRKRPVRANPVPGCNHDGTAPAAGFDKPSHLFAFKDQGADIAYFQWFVPFSAQYVRGHPYGWTSIATPMWVASPAPLGWLMPQPSTIRMSGVCWSFSYADVMAGPSLKDRKVGMYGYSIVLV